MNRTKDCFGVKRDTREKVEKMGKDTRNLVAVAQRVVEFIYQGRKLPVYENSMACIYPVSYRNSSESRASDFPIPVAKGICSVVHDAYRLLFRSGSTAVMAGRYSTIKRENGQKAREYFNITIVLDIAVKEIKVIHVHISKGDQNRFYQLQDIDEHRFRVHESEILYLEAGHNHVIWHCEERQVETNGSLQDTEKALSGEFVRIHRSFIVNRNHISGIERCCAKMDNDEVLPIPVKRYCEIKKKLQSPDQ